MENVTENLAEMILTAPPISEGFNPSTLDTLNTAVEEAAPIVEPEIVPERAVVIATLPEWFAKYSENADTKPVKIVIKGVNPDNILIVSYPTGVVLEDGSEEKDIELFKRANKIPALDLPASIIDIYSNSYRMIQEYGDGVWIKAYGLKTNIILSFCINVDGLMIPFHTSKVKRKEKIVVVPAPAAADLEALELRYKQSKGIEAATNMDAVRWLIEKQKDVADINHHLQIDSVIMTTLDLS